VIDRGDDRAPCTCTIACQGQSSLDAEGANRSCRLAADELVDVVCDLCRGDRAHCTFDGQPLCLGCGDDAFERAIVLELAPELARSLPSLREVGRERYWRRA
jgi:hypothetical protein